MMRMKVNRNNLKLKGGMKGVKFLIFIFSFIFLVFGIKMIVIGSLLNIQFKDYLDFQGSTSISDAALFIVAFGSLVTFISFFGCTGSIRESRCMILTFSTLLVITFFCELALVFIGFSLKDRMYQILQEEMIKSINSTKPGIMKTWNVIQREFECCGFLGAEDWQRRSSYIPNSCCLSDLRCPNEENPLFAEGCYEVLTKWTSNNLSIMTSVILIISILQIFGTTFSCLLAKNIKRGYDIVD